MTTAILALEDSPSIQKILALLIRPLGKVELDMAGTLDEALEMIRRRAATGRLHDLVITDLNCPGHEAHPDTLDRGGLALGGLLRRDQRFKSLCSVVGGIAPGYADVPILMFTANPDGVQGYEPPPVDRVLFKGEYLKVSNQSRFQDLLRRALRDGCDAVRACDSGELVSGMPGDCGTLRAMCEGKVTP